MDDSVADVKNRLSESLRFGTMPGRIHFAPGWDDPIDIEHFLSGVFKGLSPRYSEAVEQYHFHLLPYAPVALVQIKGCEEGGLSRAFYKDGSRRRATNLRR